MIHEENSSFDTLMDIFRDLEARKEIHTKGEGPCPYEKIAHGIMREKTPEEEMELARIRAIVSEL